MLHNKRYSVEQLWQHILNEPEVIWIIQKGAAGEKVLLGAAKNALTHAHRVQHAIIPSRGIKRPHADTGFSILRKEVDSNINRIFH